jgi:hypothetical protein
MFVQLLLVLCSLKNFGKDSSDLGGSLSLHPVASEF